MSDINKIMEAYLGMVSDRAIEEGVGDTAIAHQTPYGTVTATKRNTKGMKGKQDGYSLTLKTKSGKTVDLGSHPKPNKANVLSIVKNMMENLEEGREECPKCEGKGCDHCDDKGYHEVSEKKLDPVDDKENDKKFKNRKDKDIDNDGDVDSSDEYLHKKRKATSDAMNGKMDEVSADLAKAAAKADKVAINKSDDEKKGTPAAPESATKKDSQTPSQKYAEYKRGGGKLSMDDWKKHQRESLDIDLTDSFESMWSAMSEAANPKKGALAGEKYDDHSSKHDKEVISKHKKSEKKYEDDEEDGHTKTFAAAKAVKKQAPARSGADNLSNGDKSVVNPVKGK